MWVSPLAGALTMICNRSWSWGRAGWPPSVGLSRSCAQTYAVGSDGVFPSAKSLNSRTYSGEKKTLCRCKGKPDVFALAYVVQQRVDDCFPPAEEHIELNLQLLDAIERRPQSALLKFFLCLG